MFPRRVTAITGKAVVNVSGATAMLAVHHGAVVSMAIGATEDCIVGRIRMAVIASGPPSGMSARIDREFVDELSSGPRCRGVTRRTGCGKSSRHVIGIRDVSKL